MARQGGVSEMEGRAKKRKREGKREKLWREDNKQGGNGISDRKERRMEGRRQRV